MIYEAKSNADLRSGSRNVMKWKRIFGVDEVHYKSLVFKGHGDRVSISAAGTVDVTLEQLEEVLQFFNNRREENE